MKKSLVALVALALMMMSCGSETPTAPIRNDIDGCLQTQIGTLGLPADFTASGYAAHNPDLVAAFCGEVCNNAAQCEQLAAHYATAGAGEGRTYKSTVVESSSSNGKRSNRIGFLPYYAKVVAEDIDYSRYTQLNYFSATINADGTLKTDQMDKAAAGSDMGGVLAAARAAGIPIWYTIGGANRSENMAAVFADPGLRSKFAANAIAYAEANGYQGIDIDWEFPKTDADANAQTAMLCELYQQAKPKNLGVSVDIPTHFHTVDYKTAVTHADFGDCVDQINVMTYDYYTSGTRQNDPAAEAIRTMDYWIGLGLPQSKLNMGIAFYGKNCLDNPCTDMTWSDYYYVTMNFTWEGMRRPFISEEDDRIQKADYIAAKQLEGVLYWEVSHDVPLSDSSFPMAQSKIVTSRIAAWWDEALKARGM